MIIYKEPYDIWIEDDFLSDSELGIIEDAWPSLNSELWHRGHEYINEKKNTLEQGMMAISDISILDKKLRDILYRFHTVEFIREIKKLFSIDDNLIFDDTYRWSGLRMMLPESFQLIHSDARQHPENGLRKELTCLLYLNKDWINSDEGCLEIWDDDLTFKVHEIKPLYNRLLIFRNLDTSYHGVPKVNKLRKSITWSIMSDASTNSHYRTKARFVARQDIDDSEINRIGLERSMIEDKK